MSIFLNFLSGENEQRFNNIADVISTDLYMSGNKIIFFGRKAG